MPRIIYDTDEERAARTSHQSTPNRNNGIYAREKKKKNSALTNFSELMSYTADVLISRALPETSGFDWKIKSSHLRHTNYLYKVSYIFRHFAKVFFLILAGIFKTVLPILFPLLGAATIVFSIWASDKYSIALDVMLDSKHIAYVADQQTFDDIRASVETKIFSSGEGEYMTESIPTLKFVIIPKGNLTDREQIADILYNSYQEYIGQSYGLFVDGVMLGTSKNENEFTRLLEEVASYYLTGEKGETYSILNTVEIVRDTYPKNYERSYDELLMLFKSAQTPVVYTVSKNDTAEKIASENGISVPVLSLLNGGADMDTLVTGQTLVVGKPFAELRVQTVRNVFYTDVEGYDTKYIYTDSLFEGTKQTKQKGTNGIYEITAEVREINGVETYRAEVSRKKVKDAVAQQILIGTKTIAPSGTFIWPLADNAGYISSGYGSRTLRGKADFHRGTDIAADYGTKILAADGGVIVEYGYQSGGLGNYIAIDHGNGIISYYGHCSKLEKSVSKGTKVYQGQVIAYVGSTGNSTGNHLHFGLYNSEKDTYFDPLPYISK